MAIVAMCLAAVLAAADMSSSIAVQQTHASVVARYRGFHYQIVPDRAEDLVTGAIPVQTDDVVVVAGSRSADVTRSRVGADSVSADPSCAQFGLLVAGRHPSAAAEVSLSESAAAMLAVAVGEDVRVGAKTLKVVGIFALPANPEWESIAGVVSPTIQKPAAWFSDEIPEDLGDAGYKVNSAEFETMLATEVIDAGPLGFVRFFRPAFTVLAACLFAFMVMLFRSGVSREHRGLVAAGMRERHANAVVSVACALSGAVGAAVGWMIAALAFHLVPGLGGRPWGMRWLDVPLELRPSAAIFLLVIVSVALLLPTRRSPDQRPLRQEPLPHSLGLLAVALCAAGAAMIAYPRQARVDVALNWWLALLGAAVVSFAMPMALAALTRRSKHRALPYIAKQRARRALVGTLLLTLIVFGVTVAATRYAHVSKVNEAWYRPPQPAGSLAVREVPNPDALRRLAEANPGDEFSIRGDSTGLLAVRPSVARSVDALAPPVDEERMASCDPTGEGIGWIGEPGEVWTIGIHPGKDAVLADPSLIENGHVVIGRLRGGRFMRLSTVGAVPTSLLGGGGGFPGAVVDSLARYGSEADELRSMALLDFAKLPRAHQGQLEGLARSVAPTAFVDVDLGYRDGGFYAFSQFLGYGVALLVALMAVGLGLQLASEEREVRLLIARSGWRSSRRLISGVIAFSSVTIPIAVAAIAALTFTRDTGRPEIPQFGHTALAFVFIAVAVTIFLGLQYASEPET